MPLYEYRCPACEQRFEVLQPIGSDGRSLPCPQCGTVGPDKLLSTFAGHAKGAAAAAADCGAPACGTGFT